jgi:hypothetical protein
MRPRMTMSHTMPAAEMGVTLGRMRAIIAAGRLKPTRGDRKPGRPASLQTRSTNR